MFLLVPDAIKVKALHPRVSWVAKARWVVDGNIWTSSGISAGIDLTFAWMAEVFGEDTAQLVADRSEYEVSSSCTYECGTLANFLFSPCRETLIRGTIDTRRDGVLSEGVLRSKYSLCT